MSESNLISYLIIIFIFIFVILPICYFIYLSYENSMYIRSILEDECVDPDEIYVSGLNDGLIKQTRCIWKEEQIKICYEWDNDFEDVVEVDCYG